MLLVPPSAAKPRWVYDDPSGVPEPMSYLRPWPRRMPKRAPQVTVVRSPRIAHREG